MTLQKQEVFVIQFSQDARIVVYEEIHATFCPYPDGHIGEGNVSEFMKQQICRFLEAQGIRQKL